MDGQTWLQLMQFLLNLQNHIGYLVGSALTISLHATYINIGKVVVCARFQCSDTNLWRGMLVVELNPQT